MLIIGSHVGFKKDTQLLGSLKEALSYGANTFMFYTGAPQNTMRYDIDDSFTKEAMSIIEKEGIDYSKVIVHAPYIVNLANNKDPDKDPVEESQIISKEIFSIRYLWLPAVFLNKINWSSAPDTSSIEKGM